ncbi:MAG: hypothetical protein ACYC6N_04230 [Pirellulaceae bacterium]
MKDLTVQRVAHLVAQCLLVCLCGLPLSAGEQNAATGDRQSYRSENFDVYTDLSAEQAGQLLTRLETTLRNVSEYWKRPSKGMIQCYVVQNLDAWHDRELPHPMARIFIGCIGGAAMAQQGDASGTNRTKIVVFAAARPGVAEHEIVHAYCGQTFGTTGPFWYREGMAQLMTTGNPDTPAMNFPPEIVESLRSGRKHSLTDVVRGSQHAEDLCNSLDLKTAQHAGLVGLVPISQWNDENVRSLGQMMDTYAWSWLTCHLLEYNPNYRARFRILGQDYLAGRTNTFDTLFESVADQLDFEYQFTVDHMAPGYRVDLCAWDWDKRFRPLKGSRPVRIKIAAARGYQPSGLLVTAGEPYAYSACGTWTTDAQCGPVTADGSSQGSGRLEAVVMRDFQLSEPIPLGRQGKFLAPGDGQLYVRCGDAWSQVGDNEGSVVVTFSRGR